MVSSANPSLPGQPVCFAENLNALAPGAELDGQRTIQIDGTNAGGPIFLTNATGSYTLSGLAHGIHTATVEYPGDMKLCWLDESLAATQLVNTPPFAGPMRSNVIPEQRESFDCDIAPKLIRVECHRHGAQKKRSDAIAFAPCPDCTNYASNTVAPSMHH